MLAVLTLKYLYPLYSDLDIAVWGLDEKHYYRAVAKLLELDPAERVELVTKVILKQPRSSIPMLERLARKTSRP